MPTVVGMAQMTVGRRPAPKFKAYSAWESGQSRPANLPATAEHLEEVTGIDRSWWLGWGDGAAPTPPALPRLDSNQQPAG